MSDGTPQDGLRLLAMLIVADLRAGGPTLAEPADRPREDPSRRGRRSAQVTAVAAPQLTKRAA